MKPQQRGVAWRAAHPDYQRDYYAANPERGKRYSKVWNERHPEKYRAVKRASSLKRLYGLTTQDFLTLLDTHDNKCSICQLEFNDTRSPFIDHDHEVAITDKKGSVRGLLCIKCNFGIGNVDESTDSLVALYRYLKTPTPSDAPIFNPQRPKDVEREYRKGLREACNHKCMVCYTGLSKKGKTKECIDHDHATGKIRGVLCLRCNSALGHFDEDSVRILAAIEYLRKWKYRQVSSPPLDYLIEEKGVRNVQKDED